MSYFLSIYFRISNISLSDSTFLLCAYWNIWDMNIQISHASHFNNCTIPKWCNQKASIKSDILISLKRKMIPMQYVILILVLTWIVNPNTVTFWYPSHHVNNVVEIRRIQILRHAALSCVYKDVKNNHAIKETLKT